MNHPRWEGPSDEVGTTASERYLTKLARTAFLSLWSHSNVYTDEGRSRGKGDGKELCDLLVVFGEHVLLFSDKECEFKTHADIKVAWSRWYRRAVEKSVRQLLGAESFLRNHPDRLFLDKSCATALPLKLPSPDEAKYHLIAITRGSNDAAAKHWGGGSSGSLMIDTSIELDDHHGIPFRIGWPAGRHRFVHVLDEMTLDIVLDELDTVADFVGYLHRKETFLSRSGTIISVAGEEELVARYMATMRDGEHAFPEIPPDSTYAAIVEGDWDYYSTSQQRKAKREADTDSKKWDWMIEYQSGFIRSGTALLPIPGLPDDAISKSYDDHERIVRAMAEESRLSRRMLQKDLDHAFSISEPGKRFARISRSGSRPDRFYVFLSIPKPPDVSYEEYRAGRFESLLAYCHGLKLKFPSAREAVGIASEPFSDGASSQDFLFLELGDATLSASETALLKTALDEMGILQAPTMRDVVSRREYEFPTPFRFGEDFNAGLTDAPPNRAQRRAMAAAKRRKR